MNVLNMFWAFIATILGVVMAAVLYPIINGLILVMTVPGSAFNLIANAGLFTMILMLLIVIPVAVALDDDGRIKKAIGLDG